MDMAWLPLVCTVRLGTPVYRRTLASPFSVLPRPPKPLIQIALRTVCDGAQSPPIIGKLNNRSVDLVWSIYFYGIGFSSQHTGILHRKRFFDII